MAGYSSTPLARKLGMAEGSRVLAIGAPTSYRQLLAPLPPGVVFDERQSKSTDLIHVFVTKRADLARRLESFRARMRPDAALWVSWPKKTARLPTDITEDVIRELALPTGLVDIKVCAIDETWSALKLVVRKELRS